MDNNLCLLIAWWELPPLGLGPDQWYFLHCLRHLLKFGHMMRCDAGFATSVCPQLVTARPQRRPRQHFCAPRMRLFLPCHPSLFAKSTSEE